MKIKNKLIICPCCNSRFRVEIDGIFTENKKIEKNTFNKKQFKNKLGDDKN